MRENSQMRPDEEELGHPLLQDIPRSLLDRLDPAPLSSHIDNQMIYLNEDPGAIGNIKEDVVVLDPNVNGLLAPPDPRHRIQRRNN
jgi:hypothetical protein